jgi:IS5 family transposase
VPLVEAVTRTCGERPQRVSADSGFFSNDNARAMEQINIDAYVPDSNLARVLNRGGKLHVPANQSAHQRMRRKLRSPVGRAMYQRRKALVEPIMGVLKEQRGLRRFRLRGLPKVSAEFALAVTALNLTRLWRLSPHLQRTL